jgi:transcriptional regulator with XRE-family HTH domain
MNRAEISAAIKSGRKLLNLSQKQLAEKVGTPYQRIAEIENGKTNVNIDRLVEIAEAIGLQVTIS